MMRCTTMTVTKTKSHGMHNRVNPDRLHPTVTITTNTMTHSTMTRNTRPHHQIRKNIDNLSPISNRYRIAMLKNKKINKSRIDIINGTANTALRFLFLTAMTIYNNSNQTRSKQATPNNNETAQLNQV